MPKAKPDPVSQPAPEDADARPARTGGALVIGTLTMTSRVLGLVRDILFAALFFGRDLDVFALAFTVPNLFRRLFGEGALAGALVPALVEKIDKGDREGASLLASRALGAIVRLLGIIAAVVVASCAVVALVLGTASKTGLIAGVLTVVMPYVVLICGAAVLMAYLNASRHFAAPAAAPVLLNIALITMALLTHRSLGVWGLALAVLAGGVLQFVFQLVPARRLGFSLLPAVRSGIVKPDPELARVARAFVPTAAGLAVFQVNVLLDRVIAEGLIPGDGAVGTLFLGNRLMQLPLAVFALSIATAALPELSSRAAGKGKEAFHSALRGATGSILFWIVPAAVGLALLAQPITALLFDRGAFHGSSAALSRTSLVVIFYAPGLVAFGVSALYARALYARGEPKAVMRAALWSVGVNVVLNIVLVMVFQHIELAPGLGAGVASGEAGLALASSASGFVYLAILASFLRGGERPERRGLSLAAAALAGGAVAALATRGLLEGETLARAWDWMWLAPKLPATVCVGALAATAIVLGGTDAALVGPVARTSLTAAGMGVFANLVLSSLHLAGPSWAIPVQRAIAPVVLGAVSYWFLAGLIAAPEYERARSALAGALRLRRRQQEGESGPTGDSGADEAP